MKKKWIILFAFATSLILAAFKVTDDIIKKLGLETKTAQSFIMANFIGRHNTGPMDEDVDRKSFDIPYMRLLPSIITGNKAEITSELCTYIKAYVNSEEFITDYINRKEDAMPLKDNNGRNITSLKKDKVVIEKNIKNYLTDTKYVAEQQKLLEATQKGIDQIIANSKKPFPNKDNWGKIYPANPEVFVKQRLQEYLALVATVDFNASLTEPDRYKKRKFVNPVYEKKNFKWKACFRAGKEVNDIVTAFVKEWLKGEIISKEKIKMVLENANGTSQQQAVTNQSVSVASNNSVEKASMDTVKTETNQNKSTEKNSGLKKLKNKLGTIIKN